MDLFRGSLLETESRTKLDVRQRLTGPTPVWIKSFVSHNGFVYRAYHTLEKRGRHNNDNESHLYHSSAINLDCFWASSRCSQPFVHLRAMQEARMVQLSVLGRAKAEEHPLPGGGMSSVRFYQQPQKMSVLCWYSVPKIL
jgi:hypothetical protein